MVKEYEVGIFAGIFGEIERCSQHQAGLVSVWFHFGTTVWRKLCSCLLVCYYYFKLFHSESVYCLQWNLICSLASISAQSGKKEVGYVTELNLYQNGSEIGKALQVSKQAFWYSFPTCIRILLYPLNPWDFKSNFHCAKVGHLKTTIDLFTYDCAFF